MSLLPVASAAQNLDPTVEVNRAYEGKLLEVHKPVLEMALPDSVQRFDLDFDYDVFENPYKGSYDFKPYQLLLKPFASEKEMSVFWLRAGAGYSLHPEVDLVWSPIRTGDFKINVYADHRSYIGGYRSFRPEPSAGGSINMDRWVGNDGKANNWNGHNMRTKAGVDGQYDWNNGSFSFDLGYYGIASKDTLKTNSYNAFDAAVSVKSKPREGENYLHYDIKASYNIGGSGLNYASGSKSVSDNTLNVDTEIGFSIAGKHLLFFEVDFLTATTTGMVQSGVSEFTIAPHYMFSKGKWNIDLGLKLSKIAVAESAVAFKTKGQLIYPDVKIRWAAVPEVIGLYLYAGGGNRLNTYRSLLERNAFISPLYENGMPVLDASVDRFSARFGFDGKILRRFAYDIYAGYTDSANELFDAAYLIKDMNGNDRYLPGVGYASYRNLYAGLDWNLRARSFTLDGSVKYNHYMGMEDAYNLFAPAAFTGNASFEYNWNRRIFAGVDCAFASARKGLLSYGVAEGAVPAVRTEAVMPGFADLGVTLEYAMSRRFSLWLRGGNLLNMTVQYSPLYAEKGIYFTAGICLKL